MIIMYDLCSLMLYILAFYLGLIVWRNVFMDVTRTMMQPTVLMQVTIVQFYNDSCYHCAVVYDVHRMYLTVIQMIKNEEYTMLSNLFTRNGCFLKRESHYSIWDVIHIFSISTLIIHNITSITFIGKLLRGFTIKYNAFKEKWIVQVSMTRGVLWDHSTRCGIPRATGTTKPLPETGIYELVILDIYFPIREHHE